MSFSEQELLKLVSTVDVVYEDDREERRRDDDQRELDKLKQKADRLNKTSYAFAVQHGSSEEGISSRESSGLKKSAGELTSDRDPVNAELSAVVEYLAKFNDMCVAKVMKCEEKPQRRAAETAGLKEALSVHSV